MSDIKGVTEELVRQWACLFSGVGVVVIGAGPPCQGVSGLNWGKKGALKDVRSVLFKEVPRVARLFRQCFPWAQVHELVESVASMSFEDCAIMSQEFDNYPWLMRMVSLCVIDLDSTGLLGNFWSQLVSNSSMGQMVDFPLWGRSD